MKTHTSLRKAKKPAFLVGFFVVTLIATNILMPFSSLTSRVQAAAPVREFSASVMPTSTTASSTESYTVTITNSSGSTDSIKSAQIILPAGFVLQDPPTPTVGNV